MNESLTLDTLYRALGDVDPNLEWAARIRDAERVEVKTTPYCAEGTAYTLKPGSLLGQDLAGPDLYVVCRPEDETRVRASVAALRPAPSEGTESEGA